ncbi:nucleolar protein 12 [Aspergillus nomiae NRRL 13137]|uniref:Nucleolar protein 12 n=1 Tax=Aspergillus nomiae NRRL (strain ATCC 15546 / NRRL 13137 / CBS 260.88 / M93) TaxID=1509407 RepID=A0A0L1J863_ASPN3|nr:nucleolar protein 12 [Aspergillus nomiae NRRL 13137]KNG87885.1 nucleolar protein 12 [Aspergillus nomiae NRRL 13137]
MGKKSKSQSEKAPQTEKTETSIPFLAGNASVDPTLASLFETSSGPVKAPSLPTTSNAVEKPTAGDKTSEDVSEPEDEDQVMQEASEASSDAGGEPAQVASEPPSRKRKRAAGEDLEESYMRRIAKEEQKEDEKRRVEKAKRQKAEGEDEDEDEATSTEKSDDEDEDKSSDEDAEIAIPKHETLTGDAQSSNIDKSNRTVFLSNVSNEAIKSKSAKKTLLKHFESFLSTLPESTGPHKVESIRFRSTAFASGGKVPKRAAFAKREVLDETTPSTNAYIVYSTVQAARKAPAALNGTVVLDRHVRVDSVAHPAPVDNKRCVFPKKKKAPADVEEGLWRTFNAHTTKPKGQTTRQGNVESVRVVRDSVTRVAKGFAYVQFYDQNCVEEALLLDGKHFPPMLPRKLRVMRAKKQPKKREAGGSTQGKSLREADKTLQGRAGKLFGRAGAAKVRADATKSISKNSLVFEGHRATDDGSSRIRVKTKSRGSKGKPKNRSSKRAAAYKAAGGKKRKTE